MKTIFTCIIALSFVIASNAQDTLRHSDISVQIIAPADGAVIPHGDSAFLSFVYTNNGPDTLPAGDTVFFLTINGIVFYSKLIQDFGVGETFEYDDILYVTNPADTELNIDLCLTQLKQSDVVYNDGGVPATTYVDTNAANDTSCVSITLAGAPPSGIFDNTKKNNTLSLYPNPAKDWVFINTANTNFKDDVNITIVDIAGKIIQQIQPHDYIFSGGQYRIKTDQLSTGVYFIKVQNKNNTAIGKLMIIR